MPERMQTHASSPCAPSTGGSQAPGGRQLGPFLLWAPGRVAHVTEPVSR